VAKRRIAVVFIHGLFSGPTTWGPLQHLLERDRDIQRNEVKVDLKFFPYDSPKFKLNPLRRIPNLNDIAESLKSYLDIGCEEYEALILISHSQGGLVLQRYLQRQLNDERGLDLQRIKKIVMFACPNSGSELFLTARKWVFFFFPHSQAKELGTLNDAIAESQRKVIHNVVRATSQTPNECRIPIFSYFGQTDNIVRPVSAMGLFLETGSMPGDHFTIIQPVDKDALVYKTVKKHLLATCLDLRSDEGNAMVQDAESRQPPSEEIASEERWAFAWTADNPEDELNGVVAEAVQFMESVENAAPIFSLRVDKNSEVFGRDFNTAVSDVIQKSTISIIISDDVASSYHCLQVLRATIEAEKRLYILSQGEISNESKIEILAAGGKTGVETIVYEAAKLQDQIVRILLKTGSKSNLTDGNSGSARMDGS
jgi:hypothetical protein